IAVGPAHSSDGPIDIDSESEEFTGGETEEEPEAQVNELGGEEDNDPEWHDTQDILQAERVKQSAERVTLVSEEMASQDLGGEDESRSRTLCCPRHGRSTLVSGGICG
ncbi:hypothetical protein KI387_021216, partial [Taxus chinensis]